MNKIKKQGIKQNKQRSKDSNIHGVKGYEYNEDNGYNGDNEFNNNMIMNIDLSIDYDSNGSSSDNDIKNEIDNILANMMESDLDMEPLEHIEEIRDLAIDKVFSSYMVYEKNHQNKINAQKELKNYRFVDISDLNEGDYVRYFNLTSFYDLKLASGGTIVDINFEDTGDLIIFSPFGIRRIKPNIFFKKIKTHELLKLKLLQIANSV